MIMWQLANLSRRSQNIKVGMATVIKLLLFFNTDREHEMRRAFTVKRKRSLANSTVNEKKKY